jgi:hypothetical protein
MQHALDDYLDKDGPPTTPDFDAAYEEAFGTKAKSTVRTDPAARALADTPRLTGDPEYDRLELEETDPNRAPIEHG